LNYSGKFGADVAGDGLTPYSHGQAHLDTFSIHASHAPAGAIIVPDAQLLFNGDFKRSGLDLILSKDDHRLVLEDYFKGEKRAALSSPDGAHLTGDLVNALTGHVEYSQADGSGGAGKIIGHVTKLTGTATAIRNGVSIILNNGDDVEKGDVVQSGSDSTLGITFIDGTVFGLSSNARMVLNEMVYDPNGSNNSSLLSLVAGTISFVAGETAKHGDMKIDTPVATMGIRGTAVLASIYFHVPIPIPGAIQQALEPTGEFQILVEPDGTTGSYILFDKNTLTPIATVNQAGQQINISQGQVSVTNAPLPPDIQKLISDVFSLKFTDNTNTKSFTKTTDSLVPETLQTIKLADGATATPVIVIVNKTESATTSKSGSLDKGIDHIPGPPKVQVTDASLKELAGVTGSIEFQTTTKQITWEDINVGDQPSATIKFGSFTFQNAKGEVVTALNGLQLKDIGFVSVDLHVDQVNTNYGSATWTYLVRDHAFDFLAEGETLTLTYMATVNNNFLPFEETTTKSFTITITGSNDAPVLAADSVASHAVLELAGQSGDTADQDAASGTLSFADVDLTNIHTSTNGLVSAVWSGGALLPSGLNTVLGASLTTTVTDSTGTGTGSVGFKFSAADNNFDFLAAGETLTVIYNVTVSDGTVSSTQPVTITITGTNDAPVLAADSVASHAVLELAGQSGDTADQDAASGTLSFADVDLTNIHTSTNGLVSAVWSGGALLPSGLNTVLGASLTTTVTDSTGTGTGSVGFKFSAADNNFDFLAAGETLTVIYNVSVSDGTVSSTQPVTITITGTNDAPVLAADSVASHAVLELAGQGGDTADQDAASGTLSFADVDLTNIHTSTNGLVSAVWSGGTLLPSGLNTVLGASLTTTVIDSTGTGTGSVGFKFSAADNNFDFLAAGATLTLVYNVTVSDGTMSSTQPVTIIITGSNDQTVLTSVNSSLVSTAVTESAGDSSAQDISPINGSLALSDRDIGDTLTAAAGAPIIMINDKALSTTSLTAAQVIALTAALDHLSFGAPVTSNGGTQNIDWTWDPSVANLDFLNSTDHLTVTYAVHVADSATQDLVFTINGTNDAPVITGTSAGAGSGGNLVTNGGFESGNFAGWTLSGNPGFTFVSQAGSHGGTYNAQFGPIGSDGHLTQSVSTVAGQHYTLDFWLANDGGTPNDFSVSFNGTTLSPQLVNLGSQPYTEYKFDVIGAGPSSALEFTFRQDPAYWHLDDISLSLSGNLADGAITFTDPDNSTHTATVTPAGAGYLGTLSLDTVNESNGTGSIAWHFNGSSSAIQQFLNPSAGHPITQTYDVTINDGSGATVVEKVGLTAGSSISDTFVFAPGMGQELLFNFSQQLANNDRIDLSHFGIDNFNQLTLQSVNNNHDTLIDLGHHDSLLLVGISATSLAANEFILHA
jgi:VCBS repeat-containing protein